MHWIRADNPYGFDVTTQQGIKHRNGGQARSVGQFVNSPQLLNFCAMYRIGNISVRRKHGGHATDLTSAHGVGLTGQ